jgi:hypothetical protein
MTATMMRTYYGTRLRLGLAQDQTKYAYVEQDQSLFQVEAINNSTQKSWQSKC